MVLVNEKDFPRGGQDPSTRVSLPKSKPNVFQLFAKTSATKRSKQKRGGKKRKVQAETFVANNEHVLHLSYKALVEGMVILGRVRRVESSSLSVSLPGHICGRVSISDVSKTYSSALKALAQNGALPQQECHRLEQMFRAGQPVVVRVEALGPARTDVRLSTDPGRVQGHLPRASLKEGAVLVAAVRSEEDHVYVMDVGLSGTRAFLKKQSVLKYLRAWTAGLPLGVGQVLRCTVVKADVMLTSATVELSADPQLVDASMPADSLVLDSLVPGVRCDVTVTKVLREGLEVKLSDQVIGHVHRNHLLNPLDRLEDYVDEREYSATLLYVMPTVKLPYLSLSGGVCPAKPDKSPFETLCIGTTVDNCTVMSVDGQGIVMQLGSKVHGLRGYVSHQRALGAANQDPALSLTEELRSRFPVGSHHRCRVLDYDYMDQMFICSTEKTLLKSQYVHPTGVATGELVWCEMDGIGPQFATVFVLGGEKSDYRAFTAYAPVSHLSDVPLRHPEKKFPPGSRWRARVLSVKDLNVKVTLKPSLVGSDRPALSSYEDAEQGGAYDGSVYRILDNGLLVKFYGSVAGFVPRARINADDAEWREMFYVGQTVRCYVLLVKPLEEGLFLALEPPASRTQQQDPSQPPLEEAEPLDANGDLPQAPSEGTDEEENCEEDPEEMPAEENCILRVGQRYKVCVDDVADGCLQVSGKFEGSPWSGEIPAQHVADCPALADSLLETYRAGTKLKAYCWSAREPILTLRPSAIKFFKDEQNARIMRRGLNAARSGQLIPCSVASVDSSGKMLLQIPLPDSGEPLRAPLQAVGDPAHRVEVSAIQPHRGLIGCVKFSPCKKRKLSVKLSDVCTNYSKSAVELLQSYILSLDRVLHHQKTSGSVVSGVAPGDRVRGVVKSISEGEVVVKLKPSRIACSVPSSHQRKGRLEPGSEVDGTVLFTDPRTGSVDITLRPAIMLRIASKQDGKLPDGVRMGAVLRAQVVLVKEDFVLVTLYGTKGRCRLAYVPTRSHINQLFPDTSLYRLGDKTRVVIRRNVNGKLIGVFKEVGADTRTKAGRVLKNKSDKQSSRHTAKKEAELGIKQSRVLESKVKKLKSEGKTVPLPKKVSDSSTRKSESSVSASEPLLSGPEVINGFHVSEESNVRSDHVIKNHVKPERKVKVKGVQVRTNGSSKSEATAGNKASPVKRPNRSLKEVAASEADRAASDKRRKLDREAPSGSGEDARERGDVVDDAAAALEVDFVWDPQPGQLPVASGEAVYSESSSEDEAEQQVTKKKRLSMAEKKEMARQEEARIRELEMKMMNDAQNPQTADDFDRLVLASPNSSELWVRYMAHHLQATEIEKARAVAEKALRTISFREEAEKLNVWVSLLNLENLYGTVESLNSVLKDAVQMNDAQTVYLKMLQIYCTSNKAQEAEHLVNVVCKKFKDKQEVWVQAGTACMKLGLVDKARSLLQRALASLDRKLHVATIVKFAHLEQQWGSAERAQALMEQVLTSYPQRVDVWSSYVDMLVKSGSTDIARQVLERAVAQKLSTHKMKTLFKKYLNFEESHGTPGGVSKVRQMALSYVESITNNLQQD